MLEKAETGKEISKADFRKQAPAIRTALIDAQQRLISAGFPVIILISGNEGAGKSETVRLLMEWMDSRGMEVHSFWRETEEEKDRPRFWRYWRVFPSKGRIGVFFGSWYTQPIIGRVFHNIGKNKFRAEMERIAKFEEMLARDGALVLKFWLHLSKKAQKKRLKKLEKDPETRWRVSDMDWKFFKKYDRFRKISEKALALTHKPLTPWQIVDAEDNEYRHLTVAKAVLNGINNHLAKMQKTGKPGSAPDLSVPRSGNVFRQLKLDRPMSRDAYEKELGGLQTKLSRLTRKLGSGNRSLMLVFEGNDAAGKGGSIRRLVQAVDTRLFRVIPVAAPSDEEKSHPYLWRFWRHLPLSGRVTVFDRSWYGRVLVERVEGFCAKEDWRRAYDEIREFEEQLSGHGIILIKFWLAISKEEQLRRFRQREKISWKNYKITDEDWRNRKKWDAYEAAACDMFARTDAPQAPWVMIESNNKLYGRVKVLRTAVERLKKEIG